jgi:hypothetical protein
MIRLLKLTRLTFATISTLHTSVPCALLATDGSFGLASFDYRTSHSFIAWVLNEENALDTDASPMKLRDGCHRCNFEAVQCFGYFFLTAQ